MFNCALNGTDVTGHQALIQDNVIINPMRNIYVTLKFICFMDLS